MKRNFTKAGRPITKSLKTRKYMLVFLVFTFCLFNGTTMQGCLSLQNSGDLIEYRRSGGFVGFNDHLIINVDGEVKLKRKTMEFEFLLSKDQMDELNSLLNSVDFQDMKSKYLASDKGRDLFEYDIIYGNYSIRVQDTVIPEPLTSLMNFLNQIIDNRNK